MPLTSEQQSKLQSWMLTKQVKPACPACGRTGQWQAGEIVSPPTWSQGGMSIGGPTVPTVQLVCNHCAYVMHFAAVPIGLVS